MPKYVYSCGNCEDEFEVYHGMKEEFDFCVFCGGKDSIHRIPQRTSVFQKTKKGQKVKEGIEENRKILKEMKKKARNVEHE